jgi:hypothetical protein
MALELNDGCGNGLMYPLRFEVSESFDTVRCKDDLRGGTSFGGTGGGDDIQNQLSLNDGLWDSKVSFNGTGLFWW